jgi:hypothetical protein
MKQYFCLDFKKSHDRVERGFCLRVKAESPQEAAAKIRQQQKDWQAENFVIDVYYPSAGFPWPMFEECGDGNFENVGNLNDFLPEDELA